MSQFEVETQNFSARSGSARSIVLYPILKIVAPPDIVMVC